MGAISRHCEIEDAAVRAQLAGEDMLLICASPDKIRRGYHGLLEAAKSGMLSQSRINESLERIAKIKSIMASPTDARSGAFSIAVRRNTQAQFQTQLHLRRHD